MKKKKLLHIFVLLYIFQATVSAVFNSNINRYYLNKLLLYLHNNIYCIPRDEYSFIKN